MKLQQVMSYVRRALDDYHMIQEGDRIAVGISGGKDSLTLLYALHGLKRFYPKKFEIHAVTVDVGFQNLCPGASFGIQQRFRFHQKGFGILCPEMDFRGVAGLSAECGLGIPGGSGYIGFAGMLLCGHC